MCSKSLWLLSFTCIVCQMRIVCYHPGIHTRSFCLGEEGGLLQNIFLGGPGDMLGGGGEIPAPPPLYETPLLS